MQKLYPLIFLSIVSTISCSAMFIGTVYTGHRSVVASPIKACDIVLKGVIIEYCSEESIQFEESIKTAVTWIDYFNWIDYFKMYRNRKIYNLDDLRKWKAHKKISLI